MKHFTLLILCLLVYSTSFAQCADGEVEVEIIVSTDNYGYETYWQLTPGGDNCGQNTIFTGGNNLVGCNGGGDQNVTPGNGYGNNQDYTEGPWCLVEGEAFDIHFIDDWGDGGLSFEVFVNGFSINSFTGTGAGGVFTFIALEPSDYDLSVQSTNLLSYVATGNVDLSAVVFNPGIQTITDYNLNYTVNNGSVFSHSVMGTSLSNNNEETVNHSIPIEVLEVGMYTVKIWASDLNGNTDGNTPNDTLTKMFEAGPPIPNIIDEYVVSSFIVDQIAGPSQQVDRPTDLDFHPVLTNKELWVTNKGTENSGGSTVTIYNAGESNQTSIWKSDGNAWHFMSLPTGIAFSENGNFGTSPGVYDANHNGGAAFTGPSLWSSDMEIYAEPSGGNGSHLDMLHASPECQGIAAEIDNAFWVFDGYNGDIVRYDFQDDHGPGNDYHADAIIRRYSDDELEKDPNDEIVSHLVLDKNSQWLYAVDHGNGRVIRIDINTGSNQGDTPIYGNPEASAEYVAYTGYTQELVVNGLDKPAGIDVIEDRMIISDYVSGEISIYDISSMPAQLLHVMSTGFSSVQGIKIGPDGRIWFVDYDSDGVYVLQPAPLSVVENNVDFGVYPNPTKNMVSINLPNGNHFTAIKVYDVVGKEVMSFGANASPVQLNIENLPAGVYNVFVMTNDGTGVKKLIKN